MMYTEKNLMEIEKISLVTEDWGSHKVIQFEWIEYQQDPWYGNEEIEIEIEKEQAIELIKHLKEHFDL